VQYIQFNADLLNAGQNVITLRHADAVAFPKLPPINAQDTEELPRADRFPGQVMYDALRLEIEP
jgi:rhamnogalacturonan endolyase